MIPKWIFISINPRKWSLELGPSCNHNLRSVKNLEHRRVDLEISSNETVTATKQTQLRLFKAPTRWRCRRPIRTCTEWRVQLTKRSNQYSIHLHLWHYNGNLWKSHKCWSCPSPPPKKNHLLMVHRPHGEIWCGGCGESGLVHVSISQIVCNGGVKQHHVLQLATGAEGNIGSPKCLS